MFTPLAFGLAVVLGAASPQDPTPKGAQEPRLERGLIFGSLLDANGDPWVGAEVVFESWPYAEADWGEGDLVRTETDERGRFRAPAVRGWEYRIWAQQRTADGRLRASQIVADVQAGDPVDLREVQQGIAGLTVVVGGAREAWSALEPLSLEWEGGAPRERHRVPLTGEEALEIPARVGSIDLRVIGANGQRILARTVDPSTSQEPVKVDIQLLTPKRHLLFVHEENTETPIPKARLVAFDADRQWPLGETGEDGLLEVLFAGEEWDAWGHRVVCSGRVWGFAEARDSVPDGKNKDKAQKIVDAGGRYLTAGLSEARAVRGSLAIGADAPLSGVSIVVVSEAHGQVDEGSYYGSNATWSVETDAKGAFCFGSGVSRSAGRSLGVLVRTHARKPSRGVAQGVAPPRAVGLRGQERL